MVAREVRVPRYPGRGHSVSLYDELGGDAALDAALDVFYVKVLADPQISGYFDGVDMARLKGHAKAFLAMAFGGPSHYMGRDLGSAHARSRSMGLNDDAVDAFLGHFRAVFEEFGVPEANIDAAMEIAEGGRSAVLAS
jgi:hemoglobin